MSLVDYFFGTQWRTRAKDVLPNINRMQARPPKGPLSVCALPSPTGSDGMVSSAAARRYLQRARYNAFSMGRKFVAGDHDLWPWHLHLSKWRTKHVFFVCEFGAHLFSRSWDISYTNKQKQVVKVIWHKAALPQHTDGSVVFARWRQCAPHI